MLPIVIRTTDQMLSLVPRELREGSQALGSRRARTIRTVVLPHAAPGIVSGALLAVARGRGRDRAAAVRDRRRDRAEHEPLQRPEHRALGADLPQREPAVRPGAGPRVGAALTLIVIVFVFTILARLVTAFFARRQGA